MATSTLAYTQIFIALAASSGFAGSTWAFRLALDTGDHRWTMGAVALLTASYVPYLTLLGQSMTTTIVMTSMMSQILALTIALGVFGERLTPIQAVGLVAALIATLAFSLPSGLRG